MALWDQGWRGTGPKMAWIRKIPDTWTLEIHAIVREDSRQAEHEEIGYTDTTRRSSVNSNIKRGGREAQNEKNRLKQKAREDEAQCTRTLTLVGEEVKRKRTARNKIHEKTKLSVLEHQGWWERSSKRKEPLETKDTTKRRSVYSNTNAGGRGAQYKKKRAKQKTRQDQAQYTQTSTMEGEELKKNETCGRKEKSNVWTTRATLQHWWIVSETRKEWISWPKD